MNDPKKDNVVYLPYFLCIGTESFVKYYNQIHGDVCCHQPYLILHFPSISLDESNAS